MTSYYSTTKATALSLPLASNASTVDLVDGSTFPDPTVPGNGNYTVILGYGSDREEICTVVSKTGPNQIVVTRGEDGTAATSKNAGDVVVHGVSARDFESMVTTDGAVMTGYLTLSGAPTDNLHAATKKYVDDLIALASPVGIIAPFGQSTAVTGWLLCNGQSTTGYPALAAMYGATVPDLRDKFVLGDGGSLPNTGGAATVTLTAAQSGVPEHNHPAGTGIDTPDHTHTMAGWSPNGWQSPTWFGYFSFNAIEQAAYSIFSTGGASTSHTHSVTVYNNTAAPASTAHENMPPYYALTFQVRAG